MKLLTPVSFALFAALVIGGAAVRGGPASKWVLVAAVENATGDAIEAGWLDLALQRELSDSRSLLIASQDRINDALWVLHKPANTPLDLATANEVCKRDTGIKVVITGRVQKTGTGFAMSVQLTDPVDGHALASVADQTGATLPMAIHLAALAIRKALGDPNGTVAASQTRLIHTPPRKAWDLYAQAAGKPPTAAEPFARGAEKADPAWAAAHWLLSGIISNTHPDESVSNLKEAIRLENSATPLERNLIDGAWHQSLATSAKGTGERNTELRLALKFYNAALDIDPANSVKYALHSVVSALNQPFDMSRFDAMAADVRPLSFEANTGAAQALMGRGNVAGAVPYAHAARNADHSQAPTMSVAWIRMFPAYQAWAAGDVKRAANEVDAAWKSIGDLSDGERAAVGDMATLTLVTLGQLRSAAAIAAAIPNDRTFQYLEPNATVLELRGETDKLRALLRQFLNKPPINQALRFLVPAGLLTDAQNLRGEARQDAFRKAMLTAQLAEKDGQYQEIVDAAGPFYLQPGQEKSYDANDFLMVRLVANALQGLGDPRATKVLEDYSPPRSSLGRRGYAWMQMRLTLANLYRQNHREGDAVKIEDELRKLLAVADDDFPLLRALKKQSGK